MKTQFSLIGILFIQAINILQAQTDWHITGNAATNSGTNFIGTKDTAAFKIRTNNKVRMTINSSGNVGIGTTKPQEKFHVSGTGTLARFGTGASSTNFNYWITGNGTEGSYISQTGNTTDPNSDNFRIQTSKAGLGVDYSQFFVDPDNGFLFSKLGNGNDNMGIGGFSPGYKFYVTAAPSINHPVAYIENTVASNASDGLFIKAGSNGSYGSLFINFIRPDGSNIGSVLQGSANSVSYQTLSDKRLKNIIGTSQKGLSDLMKIKIYDYTFKSDAQKKVVTGFMAQELYEIFPQAVSKPRDTNEPADKNPWMVDYGRVTPLIIKSVQEQQQMINELKKQNENLQKQINELKALLISKGNAKADEKQTASN